MSELKIGELAGDFITFNLEFSNLWLLLNFSELKLRKFENWFYCIPVLVCFYIKVHMQGIKS